MVQDSADPTREAVTYNRYLHIDELLSLQQRRSSGPEHDELLFNVIHQVYELWFKEVLHEGAFVLAVTALVISTGARATGDRARPGNQGPTTSGAATRGRAGGAISAFRIHVPDDVLSDRKQRLARARFPR